MAQELSATAVLVLARVHDEAAPLPPARLATETGLSGRAVREAVDELLVHQHARLTETGMLVRVQPSAPELEQQPTLARVALLQASREDWRFGQALRDPAVLADGVPVYGAAAARGTIAALHRSSPREVLSLSPSPLFPSGQKVDPAAHQANVSMLNAGHTRSGWIVDDSRMKTASLRKLVLELARAGEDVAVAPRVSLRMSIYDRQLAIVPIDPHNHALGCLVVQTPTLVAHLVALYHEVLHRASPISADAEISVARRTLLLELAAGAKDETIARKLAMSPRSVRRAVAAMMAETGAESRFQLALAAVRHGWITSDDLARPGSQQSQASSEPARTDRTGSKD